MRRPPGFAATLRREAKLFAADRRAVGWRFAAASSIQRYAGVAALRDDVALRLVDVNGRLDLHDLGLADHATAISELRWRPVDAIVATMSWVEQATVEPSALVSVVLATRNRCRLLPRAIASVQEQSYPNFELLVVDDASDDATDDVLGAIDDPRVRRLRGEGRGVSAARNVALAAAAGEIVAYIDDDNMMHPGWLKSVAWAFGQRPEAEALYGAFIVDDYSRTGGGEGGDLPSLWLHPYDRERLALHNLADIGAIAHRAGLPEGYFEESLGMFSDWDLLARLTTDRDPLLLPAIACLYTTDAPNRISGGVTEVTEAELVRRRAQAARGLETGNHTGDQTPLGPRLRAIAAAGPPLRFDDWALQPQPLELILERIAGSDANVVECGSGESTIAIARQLRAGGRGHLWALEHHLGWAAEVQRRIEVEGLELWATVIGAPLEPHPLALDGCEWYAEAAAALLPERIDVLVVDGPPALEHDAAQARYPAVPALADRLASGALIVVDDAARPGEAEAIGRWQRSYTVDFRRAADGSVALANWPAG